MVVTRYTKLVMAKKSNPQTLSRHRERACPDHNQAGRTGYDSPGISELLETGKAIEHIGMEPSYSSPGEENYYASKKEN